MYRTLAFRDTAVTPSPTLESSIIHANRYREDLGTSRLHTYLTILRGDAVGAFTRDKGHAVHSTLFEKLVENKDRQKIGRCRGLSIIPRDSFTSATPHKTPVSR